MTARLDIDALRAAAAARFRDVLQAVGADLARWSWPDRGRARCPNRCSSGFSISYGKGRCHCFYEAKSWDAIDLVRERYGLDFIGAAERLGDILGGTFAEPPKPRPERVRKLRDLEEVGRLWAGLPEHDHSGEEYLRGRGLQIVPDVVRFNLPGVTSDWDLERRARQGYRVAFAARRPDGSIANLSLRFVGSGPPPGEKKTVSLMGAPTKGVAIMRPEAIQLSGPDLRGDAVLITEGGPDFLAWTAYADKAEAETGGSRTWVLAAIGAGIAESVIRAFAPLLRGRWVRIGLDSDPAGEAAATHVAEAAREVGACRVTRIVPQGAKDITEAFERLRKGAGDA